MPFQRHPKSTQQKNDKTSTTKPSSKKRKRKSRHSSSVGNSAPQRDGYDDEDADFLEVEESRELTHSEIWDDSALIDAWNAAAEEYKAYNGPDKGWKNEPVHKSPLSVYSVFILFQKKSQLSSPTVFAGPSLTASVEETTVNGVNAGSETTPESDSKPIDFNTFVPTYDAALSVGGASGSDLPAYAAALLLFQYNLHKSVSQEEAFKRALEATYWSGYWTAVYHMKGSESRLVEEKNDTPKADEEPQSTVEDDKALLELQTTAEEDKAILDIGDDGEFEGEDFEEAEEDENENEVEMEVANGHGVDFVSTQR
ncbi:hypothetical protein BT96DRAFT_995396 [Gymnopus androsaceus JB14]|uniref:Survival Motor Neuron Gemin2-binding domain-containing protein n=1 Tax=Gymnopus androsaceus JB14 TaxID=1447944 RepID=A0A6A4HL82_9AGAR|nr:hypothetical protein BT96DRAFT_995396 [Gymnopus androsaceus JB14]